MATNNVFNSSMNRVGQTGLDGLAPRIDRTGGQKGEFAEALKSLRESSQSPQLGKVETPAQGALKFSNHAIERMRMRGLSFSPEQLNRIEQGVKKAASKGAQNTLLVADGSALIVSVKNNTVVTVMDQSQMKDSVVTNIDSTVLV